MLVLSALIPLIEHTKIYVIRFLQVSFGAFLIVYLLIFTTFFRAADRDSSFLERVNESNMQLIENAELITFLAINLANSEGVQNWTYQLIEDEEIDISYGKSYAQAMVNVVVLRPFKETLLIGKLHMCSSKQHILSKIIMDMTFLLLLSQFSIGAPTFLL